MMIDKTIRHRLLFATIVCCLYLFLTVFYYHIVKYLGVIASVFLLILIPVTFVLILISFIKGLIQIFLNWKVLNLKILLPVIITFITLVYIIFSPYRLSSEWLESRVVLRACFEGTQNQATIKLRANKTFELNWTGVFFYNEWFIGTYTQKGDTIYLTYATEKPYRFGDTIVNNGESLITINKFRKDSSQYFVPFYLGYCKGLN